MLNILKNKIIFLVLLAAIYAAVFFYFVSNRSSRIVLENVDIVISNANIVTLDKNSHIYNPGYLVIKGSQILALGAGNAPQKYSALKNINAQGGVIMPGLINTHSHSAMTLLDGIGQGQDLKEWLNTMSGYEAKLTSDNVYWGTLMAEAKMIKTGTTSFNDMYLFPKSTISAINLAKMRAVARIPTAIINEQIVIDPEFNLQQESGPLISFAFAPSPLLSYSVSQLKNFSDLAKQKQVLVHIHFAEDANSRKDSLFKFSLSPLELIKQTGLIENKIILAHSVDLTESEIKEISKYPNVGISFNPVSEFWLQTPLTPAVEFLNNNLTVSFGSDGEPSGNLDIFQQMKFAASGYLNCQAGQKFCANGENIDFEKIIRMATIDGAKVLGMDDKIGSLETGKQADLILLAIQDSDEIKDIYQRLVYTVNESDVTDSIIAGRVVMENKKILTFNEDDVREKVINIKKILENK
jgi:5-methylthioadenosine/S-adenosylhomocysteine deaminase